MEADSYSSLLCIPNGLVNEIKTEGYRVGYMSKYQLRIMLITLSSRFIFIVACDDTDIISRGRIKRFKKLNIKDIA